MSDFLDVETAYEALAIAAIGFAAGRNWNFIVSQYSILNSMVSAEWSIFFDDLVDDKGDAPQRDLRKRAFNAVRFLREEMNRTTGQRIWGLTFTLYSDGRFKIDYDYAKPVDYLESGDFITGEEIAESLSRRLRGS